jgi:hypothetical protein
MVSSDYQYPEDAGSLPPETLVTISQTMHILEDCSLNIRHCENFKCHIVINVWRLATGWTTERSGFESR